MSCLSEKEMKLIRRIRELGKVVVAYSGGVDSTYLMALAKKELKENAVGILVSGAMIAQAEEEEALKTADLMDFSVTKLELDILSIAEFIDNQPERCYFCKKHIFTAISNWAELHGLIVLDGTNFSDKQDYRPGRKALEELGIISPLLEAELTKAEIRELSRTMGLPTWNKPSMACLASRVPYGTAIDYETLRRIEDAEKVLLQYNFKQCRVRTHDQLARIEIPLSDFPEMMVHKDQIVLKLQKLGYRFVTLDLMGLRSGSLNPNLD